MNTTLEPYFFSREDAPQANKLESTKFFRYIFYFLFGFSRLNKIEPPKDELKKGYSKILLVKYYTRGRWFTNYCRYYFETKRLRAFDEDGQFIGSTEPMINNSSFYWKVR